MTSFARKSNVRVSIQSVEPSGGGRNSTSLLEDSSEDSSYIPSGSLPMRVEDGAEQAKFCETYSSLTVFSISTEIFSET